jgi:hypothetical protein
VREIFIFDRQSANALIKFDGMPESFLRFFEPARDAGVARKIELNHGIVVMQFAALEIRLDYRVGPRSPPPK